MNLYIETEDGVTKNHPALEDNLIQAFGAVPAHWEPFIRVAAPPVGTFEVYEGASYALVDGVWTDVHNVRPMTGEEKAAKIDEATTNLPGANWTLDTETLRPVRPLMPTTGGPWKFDMVTAKDWVTATDPPYPSWVLREDWLVYVSPVPKPQDGNRYRWDEATLSWVAFNV